MGAITHNCLTMLTWLSMGKDILCIYNIQNTLFVTHKNFPRFFYYFFLANGKKIIRWKEARQASLLSKAGIDVESKFVPFWVEKNLVWLAQPMVS